MSILDPRLHLLPHPHLCQAFYPPPDPLLLPEAPCTKLSFMHVGVHNGSTMATFPHGMSGVLRFTRKPQTPEPAFVSGRCHGNQVPPTFMCAGGGGGWGSISVGSSLLHFPYPQSPAPRYSARARSCITYIDGVMEGALLGKY